MQPREVVPIPEYLSLRFATLIIGLILTNTLRAFNSVRSEELMSGELLGTIFRSIILWTLPPIALRGIR